MNSFKKHTFPLFETMLCLNGEIKHLPWHERRRNNSAIKCFDHEPQSSIQNICKDLPLPKKGKFRLKFLYNQSDYQLIINKMSKNVVRSLQIVYDDKIEYKLKYTYRKPLATLFQKRKNADDILIVKNGFVTDTSIANIILKKQGEWFTPSTPLLKGTHRESLLAKGSLQSRLISVKDLDGFEEIRIINALRNEQILRVQ